MRKTFATAILFLFLNNSFAQVGIGTSSPNASAQLDVESTNKGFLPPRVVLTGRTDATTIASPATGLLVYNTSNNGTAPNNVTPGFYYNAGTQQSPNWVRLIVPTDNAANVTGTVAVANGGTGLTNITGGQIPFGNGTSALATSSNLTWDNSANRFNVQGNTFFKTNGSNIGLMFDGYSPSGSLQVSRIYTEATSGTPSDFVIGTYPNGQTNQIYLKQSNGFVGIRNSNPSTALDINGTVTATALVKSGGTSSQFLKADGSIDATTYQSNNTNLTSIANLANGAGFLKNNGSGTLSYTNPSVSEVTGLGTNVATFLATPSSANLAAATTDETGSGALVFGTSPSLTTPTLGAASATSINKVAITAPASSATLTIADGITLTANNSITLAGTNGTTMTFPSSNATIARIDAAQTFTGTQTFSGNISSNGNITGNGTTSQFSNFSAVMNNVTANYTILNSDNGKIISVNSAGAVTITVPPLSVGFNCMIVQRGDGQVTLSASDTTINNRYSYTKTAGKNSILTLVCIDTNLFISSGDMSN